MRSAAFVACALLIASGVRADTSPAGDDIAALASTVLNARPLGSHTRWDYALDGQGRPWLAYYAADGSLRVRRPGGSEVDLRPTDRPSATSGLALDATEGRLDVVWRDEVPRRALYHAAIDAHGGEPNVAVIDDDTAPLTRLRLARRGTETYVLWYGETSLANDRTRYDYHLRVLADDEARRSVAHRVMPGIYPTWIVAATRIPVFSYTLVDGRPVIAMRRFDRTTRRFDAFRTLVDVPPIGPFLLAFESRDRWFVMWVAHHGRHHSALQLEGIHSDDHGTHWTRFAFDDLRGLDVSQIDTAADDGGNILIAMSGAWTFRDRHARNDVYLLRSGDNGSTWSKPMRLRSDTARATTADHPSVVFGTERGSAMAVWEDWRDVRSNVQASYSTDGGATWSEPFPVGIPGRENVGLTAGVKTLRAHAGRFTVVAERFAGDALDEHDLALYSFSPPELREFAERVRAASPIGTEARLRARLAAYWTAKEHGAHAEAYRLLDPFFRSQRSLAAYAASSDRIRYHHHDVKAVDIAGRIATVRLEVDASVPEFTLSTGETVSRPRERHGIDERWVFVDDDWYREYREQPGDLRFTRY